MFRSVLRQGFWPPHGGVEEFFVFHNDGKTEKIIHISQFTFPQNPVEKSPLFVLGVDVCFDVFDDLSQVGIIFHALFHAVDGVKDGGMVSVAKFPANVIQG